MARVCSLLGHDVRRWRGPIAGAKHLSRKLPPCDVAIVFNGTHQKYARYLRQLDRWGSTALFVELGWYPQRGTIQVDPRGINAAASWVNAPLVSVGSKRLRTRSRGDLLLLLQDDRDTQITHHSPWFANMFEFVSHVAQHSRLPVRVRPHPRRETDPRVVRCVRQRGLTLDRARRWPALDACQAVCCINSSGAVEALARRIPVLCYGSAIYRHESAVYCLNDDPHETRRITAALGDNACELFEERVVEVVERIIAKQWCLGDIEEKLPDVLTVAAGSVATHGTSASTDSVWSRLWDGFSGLRRAG